MHNNTETRWHFWQHVTDNVETTWHFRRHVADNVETTWNFWWYWSRWDDIKKYRPKMAEIGETTLRNRPFFLKCCSFWLKSRDMLSILSEMLSCQDDMTCRRATWHVVGRHDMSSSDRSCCRATSHVIQKCRWMTFSDNMSSEMRKRPRQDKMSKKWQHVVPMTMSWELSRMSAPTKCHTHEKGCGTLETDNYVIYVKFLIEYHWFNPIC